VEGNQDSLWVELQGGARGGGKGLVGYECEVYIQSLSNYQHFLCDNRIRW
jgi:hypothetical protein